MNPPRVQLMPWTTLATEKSKVEQVRTFRLCLVALLLPPSAGSTAGLGPICKLLVVVSVAPLSVQFCCLPFSFSLDPLERQRVSFPHRRSWPSEMRGVGLRCLEKFPCRVSRDGGNLSSCHGPYPGIRAAANSGRGLRGLWAGEVAVGDAPWLGLVESRLSGRMNRGDVWTCRLESDTSERPRLSSTVSAFLDCAETCLGRKGRARRSGDRSAGRSQTPSGQTPTRLVRVGGRFAPGSDPDSVERVVSRG